MLVIVERPHKCHHQTILHVTQSKGFTRKDNEKIGRSVQTFVYLNLVSHVQARSSIIDNSSAAADAQQVFKSMYNAVVNENYSISVDMDRHQSNLKYSLSKVDFPIDPGIPMLQSNLNLNIEKTAGYTIKVF